MVIREKRSTLVLIKANARNDKSEREADQGTEKKYKSSTKLFDVYTQPFHTGCSFSSDIAFWMHICKWEIVVL